MDIPVLQVIYRVETPRTIIRCYDPKDAPLLEQAITESLEHLKPWMPWVHVEPEPIEKKINRLRKMRASFDLNKEFVFGIFNLKENQLIGGTGLHPRVEPNSIEIGYWIHADFTNQGIATEIAAALTKIAFEIYQFHLVEIHCDPRNIRSASIPRKLNFKHEATLRDRVLNEKEEPQDSMIWSLNFEEYQQSFAKELPIKAYNVMGNQIL
ncbi:MAG: GNAT family N-acetyltransferase [Candidatus Lokiarchaeota archaeon]|nr:GNAT family N-acetyltransferase [Candidatus Harpocratesius repetitus]